MGPPPWVPTYRDLHAHRYSVVTPFINLTSHYRFHRIDDKCGIRMIIRILCNILKPAVTAVRRPIRAGKFSNSHVDSIDCGAGRFTPIHTSLEAVRSPRSPHQSEWRQKSLCKHSTFFFALLIKTCR